MIYKKTANPIIALPNAACQGWSVAGAADAAIPGPVSDPRAVLCSQALASSHNQVNMTHINMDPIQHYVIPTI